MACVPFTEKNFGFPVLMAYEMAFFVSRVNFFLFHRCCSWDSKKSLVSYHIHPEISPENIGALLRFESKEGGVGITKFILNSQLKDKIKEEDLIIEAGHPVLRRAARELSVEEIVSPEIQKLIEIMKVTMRAARGVGLAAPQIGKPLQLAVIEDMDLSHLNPEQLAERDRYPIPFHVIINPRLLIDESSGQAEFFEGCLSVPAFLGIVSRANSVCVECLNERAEPVIIQAKGWYARILQHEIDHLNGTLYIDKVQLPTLMTTQNYLKLYKGKSIQEVQAALGLSDE